MLPLSGSVASNCQLSMIGLASKSRDIMHVAFSRTGAAESGVTIDPSHPFVNNLIHNVICIYHFSGYLPLLVVGMYLYIRRRLSWK